MDKNIKNNNIITENLAYLTDNHPEIYSAYKKFGKMVHEMGGPLDEKTRWLIKVALSTESQYQYALETHIRKALKSGCSEEEIEHAVLLVAPTSGFPKAMEGLLILRKVIENLEK